eukprot:3832153-Pleurochrysis_carterae.AAC.3
MPQAKSDAMKRSLKTQLEGLQACGPMLPGLGFCSSIAFGVARRLAQQHAPVELRQARAPVVVAMMGSKRKRRSSCRQGYEEMFLLTRRA